MKSQLLNYILLNIIYGVFNFSSIELSQRGIEKLVSKIISFFNSILENLLAEKNQLVFQDYSAVENRKKVVSHLLRERNSALAKKRKQKDDYQCQICEFKMEDIYGYLGKDYAEAHHIVPLNKIKKQSKTNVEDLITVCPNCHRMLHRMKGEKSDIVKLKSIVRKNAPYLRQ